MSKIISIEEIRRLSRESKKILFGDIINNKQENGKPIILENSFTSPDSNQSNKYTVDRDSKKFSNALKMIKTQIDYDFEFLFRTEAAKLAKIKGSASIQQAENIALKAGLIKKHQIAKAKTNICFWEITDQGYVALDSKRKKYRSKGEYKHKFCAQRIAQTFAKQGYKTKIEYRLPNDKLVDICLFKDDSNIFVEICASTPVSKELINLEKDLASELLPQKIIFAVTERKMKHDLETALNEYKNNSKFLSSVEIVLAGDLIKYLEVVK